MRIGCAYFAVALVFFVASVSFAQESNQPIYIEGKTQKADGAPVSGVQILFSDGSSVISNSSGHYFNVVPRGFAGSSTATRSGINFSPNSRSYSSISTDQLNQDFTGGTFTVSGKTDGGVGLYSDGYWQGAVSDAIGNYSITIPQGYSGSITPLYKSGFVFNPASAGYSRDVIQNFNRVSFQYTDFNWSISDDPGSLCFTEYSSYIFPPTTAAIYMHVLGYVGSTVFLSWYDPTGTLRRQTSYSITPDSFSACAVTSIAIAGTDLAQYPGVWRVDFQWTGLAPALSTGSTSFAVLPPKPPVTSPPSFGSMADLASGGGWETTIQLVNAGSGAAQANVGFFGDDGSPLALPVAAATPPALSVARTLAPNATALIDSNGPDALQTGYAQLTTDAGIGGFIRFRYAPRDQEAIVPLENRKASSYLLPFDNTGGIATGAAVANLTAVSASIPVLIRDNTGAQIGSASVSLPANGHASFVLSDRFPSAANQTGTIEFDTPANGQFQRPGTALPCFRALYDDSRDCEHRRWWWAYGSSDSGGWMDHDARTDQ